MRIVAKIATAGVSGLSRFPFPSATLQECLNAEGHLDEAKARRALDCDQIQVGSKDDRRTLAFGFEYLTQIESVVRHLAEQINRQGDAQASVRDAEKGYRAYAETPGDRRCERNMEKGRYAFVRTDITSCADGIHVKLTIQNPKGVVGNAERFARDCGVMYARILIFLRSKITTSPIILLEGDGAKGIYDEAEEMNRRDDLAKKRSSCPNLHNGFCSPSNPSCPLYSTGRCRPLTDP